MSETKSLPCPFCGGEAKAHKTYETEFVMCTECGCRTETIVGDYYDEGFMDGFQAIKKWNTRKPMERIVERLEHENELANKELERCKKENVLQYDSVKGYSAGMYMAIEIVKEEGVD